MKSFADLYQSKKLAEILPLESADMYYYSGDKYNICFGSGVYEEIADWSCDGTPKPADIPCWSLAALLSVLSDYTLQTNTGIAVFVVCKSKKPMISDANNPVDACVAMIEKLHKLKML